MWLKKSIQSVVPTVSKTISDLNLCVLWGESGFYDKNALFEVISPINPPSVGAGRK